MSEPFAGDTTRSPIVAALLASVVTAFLSVGFLAAYLPSTPPLAVPAGLLAASCLVLAAALLMLRRRRGLAWGLFFAVARWVALLTLLFGGMAEYVFIADGTRGGPLLVMTVVLALAAVDIPLLLGFSVARHDRPAA
ncbi:MAG: hypothetical protein ACREPI_13005 [Candidatus Dormibacterales bacterium]